MLVQTIFALVVVCGLAFVIFRVIIPYFQIFPSSNNMVRVVDRIGLEARKSLYIIEVAGQWYLIAVSETGVQLISELDAANSAEAEAKLAEQRSKQFSPDKFRPAFAEKLARVLAKKGASNKP
jgi:flagellar biogenesis protein FliO